MSMYVLFSNALILDNVGRMLTVEQFQDEATGVTHHLVAGDFAFFHVGTKVQFSTKSSGFAFYTVTRPIRDPHPNLEGRAEKVPGQSRL
jgi:hypothetical protein